MKEDDILVHSPEFDAAQRQFCTTDAIENDFYSMMEANYDMVRSLDIREYSCVFSSFSKYLAGRKGMDGLDYGESPSFYDEDGAASEVPVYDRNGDYVLYRQNSETSEPIYGLKVSYSSSSFPSEAFIEPLNHEYKKFLDSGVQVFFTYAPRNNLAVAKGTTSESLAELDAYFSREITVPVLGTAEESLMDGIYFYGTDNHLSSEGVKLRTERFLNELIDYFGRES